MSIYGDIPLLCVAVIIGQIQFLTIQSYSTLLYFFIVYVNFYDNFVTIGIRERECFNFNWR